jgi:hypothetical protein
MSWTPLLWRACVPMDGQRAADHGWMSPKKVAARHARPPQRPIENSSVWAASVCTAGEPIARGLAKLGPDVTHGAHELREFVTIPSQVNPLRGRRLPARRTLWLPEVMAPKPRWTNPDHNCRGAECQL